MDLRMGLHRMEGLRVAVGRAEVGLRIKAWNDTKTQFPVEQGAKFAAGKAPAVVVRHARDRGGTWRVARETR